MADLTRIRIAFITTVILATRISILQSPDIKVRWLSGYSLQVKMIGPDLLRFIKEFIA